MIEEQCMRVLASCYLHCIRCCTITSNNYTHQSCTTFAIYKITCRNPTVKSVSFQCDSFDFKARGLDYSLDATTAWAARQD